MPQDIIKEEKICKKHSRFFYRNLDGKHCYENAVEARIVPTGFGGASERS